MIDSIRMIGVPIDFGTDRRGVDMGCSAIRNARLAEELQSLGITCADGGDIPVPTPGECGSDEGRPEVDAKYLTEIEAVSDRLASVVLEATLAGELTLVLGGDHSIAIGSIGGLSPFDSLGVVWFDAHADFNTPSTSPSGNVHGMPLAALLGKGEFADADWARATNVSEENVAIVGLRSVDETEREALHRGDITTFTMSDIDRLGISTVVDEAIDVATNGTDCIHVSLDLDWLDPTEAPGVGTPIRGGVTYREAHAAMERLNRSVTQAGLLKGVELAEVNPILDEHNRTAELAVELTASLLGKKTL